MRVGLYSIHDRLAGTYSVPMAIPEKIVMRQIQYIISDMKKLDCQDKECCVLGYFDNETGLIEAEQPSALIDLSDLKEKMEEKANG